MIKKRRNIFINATATKPGGGLTILLQFLAACSAAAIDDTDIYVFNTINLELELPPFIIPTSMPKLNYLQRIMWDLSGMKKWAQKNSVQPDLIVSFQNTGVRYHQVPQIIYLQQSIPFTAHQWNFFDKSERTLWLYKNVYPFFIGLHLGSNTDVVVQTQWMKTAFLNKFKKHQAEKVFVIAPAIEEVTLDRAPVVDYPKIEESGFSFFYPAANFKYKNHLKVVQAVASIKQQNKAWNGKLYFTSTLQELCSEAQKIIGEHELYTNFVFLGKVSLQEVYRHYGQVNALIFPSYIETIGLPLIEAASFGLPILVADEPYAKEVLKTYPNVLYAQTDDCIAWKDRILEATTMKKIAPQKIKISDHSWPDMIRLIEERIK